MKYLNELIQKQKKLQNSTNVLKTKISKEEENLIQAKDLMKYADSSQVRDQDRRRINSIEEVLSSFKEELLRKETLLEEISTEIKKAQEFFSKQGELF